MKIHQIIRARRMELGLTQEQLASRLGCPLRRSTSGNGEISLPGYHLAAGAGPDPGGWT